MSTTVAPSAPPAVSAPLLTAEEFARQYRGERVELVKGVVKELPMAFPKHGMICATICYLLLDHALKHALGRVMSNDSFTKTESHPDTVRGPDVSFYSYERLPRGEVPDGLLSVQPDLAVEVRSPSNSWSAIFTKVGEYLEAGVRAVLVLDSVTLTASVYRQHEFQQIFHNGDDLVLPDVLPGFAVPVRRLFE
jgi:Uma2 family endonuclease